MGRGAQNLRFCHVVSELSLTSLPITFTGNTFGGVSALPNFEQRFGTNVAASQGFLAALYILGKLVDHRSIDTSDTLTPRQAM
jgi:hypothetical protein